MDERKAVRWAFVAKYEIAWRISEGWNAHERESIRLQSAYVLICFFFFFSLVRHQLQWRYSHNKWNPFSGRRRLIDAISALCTSRNEEDEASGQSMWAVRWEQFTFIAIGHPSFGDAVVAQSTAFYMISASKIIENNWRCRRGVFRSIRPRVVNANHLRFIFGPKMKHFQRSRHWWIWWANRKIDKRFDETARSIYLPIYSNHRINFDLRCAPFVRLLLSGGRLPAAATE